MKYNAYRNIVLKAENFDVNIEYEMPTQKFLTNNEYDLLIICPDEWKDELEQLKQHKEEHGIKTMLVGLNEIYGSKYFNSNGRDDAERIKYFIKDAIEQWGIKYVMLVGDADKMPVRYVNTSIKDIPHTPSDLYFADIFYTNGSFSSWDRDGDGEYGEKKDDKPDYYPDVYIGRLPASSEYELKILINKIIEYEQPPAKALMAGVELFWETDVREGEYLKEEISKEINIETIKLYETNEYEKDGDANEEEIAFYINKGVTFVNFASHGSPYGMGWENGSFYISSLSLLHNKYLPIVFAMACSTNEFDTTDCLGEEFLLYENGGAIAYAGSSRMAYVYVGKSIESGLSGYLDKAFFKAYYDGSSTVGEMFSTAKIDYLSRIPFRSSADILTITEYNLMGDPTIEIASPPLTSKAFVDKEISKDAIKVWAETAEKNCSIELYYRKGTSFWGGWKLYGVKNAPPYEWEFLPDEEGYYEFYTILKKGNYSEKPPSVADAHCLFQFYHPSINITKPQKGKIYIFNKEIASIPFSFAIVIGKIDVVVEGKADYVEFYVDSQKVAEKNEEPYTWRWDGLYIGRHEIKVVAYNMVGDESEESVMAWVAII